MSPTQRTEKSQQLEVLEFADKVTEKLRRFFKSQSGKDQQNTTSRLSALMLQVHEWIAEQTPDVIEDEATSRNLHTLLRNLEKLCQWAPKPTSSGTARSSVVRQQPPTRKSKSGLAQTTTGLYPTLSLLLWKPPTFLSGLKHFDKINEKSKMGLVSVLEKFIDDRIKPEQQVRIAATVRPGDDEDDKGSNGLAPYTGHDASELEKLYQLMIEDFICNRLEDAEAKARRTKSIVANIHLKRCEEPCDSQAVFRILFLDHPHKPSNKDRCQWQDTEITISTSTKLVTFEDPTKSHHQEAFPYVISKGNIHPANGSSHTKWKVKDFCDLIENRQMKQFSFEVSKGTIRVSRIRNKPSKFRVNMDSVPLKQFLQTEDFTSKHRLLLSYHLAEAVWRFYPSPWMEREWTKDSVHFMYESDRKRQTDPAIRVDKPFLHADLNVVPINSDMDDFRSHGFPKILALGILLLEIELKVDIRDHWSKLDLTVDGEPTADADYNAALSLFDETNRRPGTRPLDEEKKQIIGTCLRPDVFAGKNVEGQRAQLWEHVVEPLRLLHERSTGGNAELDPLVPPQVAETIRQVRNELIETADGESGVVMLFDDKDMAPTDADIRTGTKYFNDIKRFKEDVIMTLPSPAHTPVVDPTPWQRPVRVAILDSGIGEWDSYIKLCLKLRGGERRILDTRSWVGKETEWHDTHGHGTLVARFFLEVAPRAHLYIGKICEGKEIPRDRYRGIAQAIDHAITEWDVDIISLSFGADVDNDEIKQAIIRVLRPEDPEKEPAPSTGTGAGADKPALVHRRLNTRARIVFAAACNGGPLERRAFPARMRGVICVNASDGHGQQVNLLSPDPVAGEDNFVTLGAYVRYPPFGTMTTQYKYKSGTSFATPIAAGLAANLLEFARHRLERVSKAEQEWLYSFRGIAAVLRRLSCDNMGPYQLLRPWVVPVKYGSMSLQRYLETQLEEAKTNDYYT